MTELTDKVLSICNKHYKNCGSCPIWKACRARVGEGMSGLIKWVDRVNEEAEVVSKC